MSKTLQFRRYHSSNTDTIVASNGEIIVDLTRKTLSVHDGVTAGGSRLATELYVNTAVSNATTILLGGAPGALDTLKELADAIRLDPQFGNTVLAFANTKESIANVSNSINTVTALAQAAFNYANTIPLVDSTARNIGNSAFIHANAAYNAANSFTITVNGPYVDDADAANNSVAIGSLYYVSGGSVKVRLT